MTTVRDAQAICKDIKGDIDIVIYMALLPILLLTYYAGRPGLHNIVLIVVAIVIMDLAQRLSRMASLMIAASLAEQRGHPNCVTVYKRWFWLDEVLFGLKVGQFVLVLIMVTFTVV